MVDLFAIYSARAISGSQVQLPDDFVHTVLFYTFYGAWFYAMCTVWQVDKERMETPARFDYVDETAHPHALLERVGQSTVVVDVVGVTCCVPRIAAVGLVGMSLSHVVELLDCYGCEHRRHDIMSVFIDQCSDF